MTRSKHQVLILRLDAQEMDPYITPGFVRNLAKSVVVYPHMNLVRVGQKLNYLGWSGHELDYHAYQLALSDFSADVDDDEFPDQLFQPYFHNA